MTIVSKTLIPKERVQLGKMYDGYTLARSVFKDRDLLLIREGTVLTLSLIEKLTNNGVKNIYVYADKQGLEKEAE